MTASENGNVVLTEAAAHMLRADFIAWQCRLRQLSARQMGGRPLDGMRARVLTPAGVSLADAVTLVLVEAEPENSTTQLRFQYKKTMDPIERYDKVLDILQGAFFQYPQNFSDNLCALFGPSHPLPALLLHHGRCVLGFEQFRQAYTIPCEARELREDDPFFQATYWHNAMFNPDLPAGVRILAFQPDWPHASQRQTND